MPTALVTGAPEWVLPIALALKSEGFDVVTAGVDAPPPPGSVDCSVLILAGAGQLERVLGALAEPVAVNAAGGEQPRPWRSYLDEEPDLAFADWRDEILCLTSPTG